jgi:hypothetical protein
MVYISSNNGLYTNYRIFLIYEDINGDYGDIIRILIQLMVSPDLRRY